MPAFKCFQMGATDKIKNLHKYGLFHTIQRARDGTRTRDPDLGKVVLHQLSHSRINNDYYTYPLPICQLLF